MQIPAVWTQVLDSGEDSSPVDVIVVRVDNLNAIIVLPEAGKIRRAYRHELKVKMPLWSLLDPE